MNLQWLSWSNPVSFWWIFLITTSLINILFWLWTRKYLIDLDSTSKEPNPLLRAGLWLSMIYVLGCAFRSVLPRADVQRICLFDTWLSSVYVGRSVATLAELAFVAQWALVLNQVSKIAKAPIIERLSKCLVPLIFVAECFSWYAVISTHYLGNTIEESTWTFTYLLILVCLIVLLPKSRGPLKLVVGFSILGSAIYILFMMTVDVPMYYSRWQSDLLASKPLLGWSEGLQDLQARWVVSHRIEDWKEEIPWMSLYFSVAVWTSLALCYVPLSKERLLKYLKL